MSSCSPTPDGASPGYWSWCQTQGDSLIPVTFGPVMWNGVQQVIIAAKAQVRTEKSQTGAPLRELSTAILGGGAQARVGNYETLTDDPGTYVCDVEFTLQGKGKFTFVSGPFAILEQVTQA